MNIVSSSGLDQNLFGVSIRLLSLEVFELLFDTPTESPAIFQLIAIIIWRGINLW